MQFPSACPEVPVLNLPAALAYYRDQLGFALDWSDDRLGLAGLSRGDTRIFMTSAEYRSALGNQGPIVLWLNLSSRIEVDSLHAQWSAAGARIAASPEAKPHKLYEFFAQDIDGNFFRVFYDFAWEEGRGGDDSLGHRHPRNSLSWVVTPSDRDPPGTSGDQRT